MPAKRGRKPANKKTETPEVEKPDIIDDGAGFVEAIDRLETRIIEEYTGGRAEKAAKTAPVAKSAKPKAAMQVAKDDCIINVRKDIRRCEGEIIHAMKAHRLDNKGIQLDDGIDCAIWMICHVEIPHDLRGTFEALLPGNLVKPSRGIFYVDPGVIDG